MDYDYNLNDSRVTFTKAESIKIDHFKNTDFWKALEFRSRGEDLFYYKASDIKVLNNDSLPIVNISGNVYIIEWDRPFFHVMHDIVGEFLLIKEVIPDLKPVIIYNGPFKDPKIVFDKFYGALLKKPDFIEDLLESIDFDYDNFFFIPSDGNIFIENLYTISLYGDGFQSDLFYRINEMLDNAMLDIDNDGSYSYRFAVTLAMKNKFKNNNNEVIPYRKIFVSIAHKRNIMDRSKMLYDFLDSNGVTWSIDWRTPQNTSKVDGLDLSAFLPAQFNSGVKDAHLRYFTKDFEEEIEDFFRQNGFEIVTLEGTSLKDQIRMMSEAKVVAVWAGASELQSLFVQDGSTFIYIAPKMTYGFPHEDILEVIKPDAKIIFDKRRYENFEKEFDSATIIKAVKKILKEIQE